jgi:hypothetical protein
VASENRFTITPEMLEAGVLAMNDPKNDEMFADPETRVRNIFEAMWEARSEAKESRSSRKHSNVARKPGL